ncbi:DUF167 domain-containing protein [Rhodobacteraceae bacterium RKSG542]|uniref:DUF167 family protein n=1 Tax=Pseudovibrio flavus TaxID=2529854 RepID=UPI0012BB5C9F|nr:DUF167 family protein [Pseudovibrio flavus]MTI18320.1 DUF167 domain-containing protein [Pseudovibrio flavus]
MSDFPWNLKADGVLLAVRLTPKSSKDNVDGLGALSDGRPLMMARVRAVPDKGAANKAVCALFAKALKLPKSAVTLESGSTSRVKTLHLEGDPEQIEAALKSLCNL